MTAKASDGTCHAQGIRDELSQLTTGLDELRDLFRRRLFEDREKRRMLERLFDDLDAAKRGVLFEGMIPLVRGILLVIDRVDGFNEEGKEFVESVREELIEVLKRQGIDEVRCEGAVDPRVHDVRRVIEDGSTSADLIVECVEKRGFQFGNHLVRPAAIVARKV